MRTKYDFLLLLFLLLFGVVGSIFTSPEAYWLILLIGAFSFLIVFDSLIRLSKNSLIFRVFYIVVIFRYFITPVFFIYAQDDYVIYLIKPATVESLYLATALMLVELLVCLSIIHVYYKYFYSIRKADLSYHFIVKNNSYLGFAVGLFGLITIFLNENIRNNYNFINVSSEYTKKVLSSGEGLLYIISDFSLVFIPVFFVVLFYRMYADKKSKRYVYLALLVVLPTILFFKGVSRFSALLPALSWVIFFGKIFPLNKKLISNIIFSMLSIVIVSVTLYKQFGYSSGAGAIDTFEAGKLAVILSSYFSGVYNVAYSLDTISYFGELNGFKLFYNDFLRNIAFFSSFSDTTYTSTYFFNRYVYTGRLNSDQIVPVLGQSYMYFGYFAFYLFSCVATIFICILNTSIDRVRNIYYLYPLSYLGLIMSVFMMLSLNSIYSTFFNFILPVFFVYIVISFFSRVKRV